METVKTNYRGGAHGRGLNEQTAIEWIALKAPWFEYVGDYKGIDAPVKVKCKTCGSILVRSMVTIRAGQAKCSVCRSRRIEANRIAKAEEREKEKERRERERKQKKEQKEAERLSRLHPCVVCGRITSNKYCCSAECSNKRSNRIKEVKRRAKLLNALIDEDITLEELYKRDSGICYICGKKCDWNDRTGNICGNKYPSVDHVIPLSKGGLHEWSNVKLAHRICNSRKSDNIAPPC